MRDGYEPDERTWRHGDCMFYPTYVHCRRPRVKCPKCGGHQVNAPFERKGSRFTTYFEGYAMMLMADMSRSYCPAIAENFPNATHVMDKFHVKQTVTNAMDEVRKEEQKEVEDKKELFRKRKLFFKPSAALTQGQAEEIAALSRRFPKTGRAFRISGVEPALFTRHAAKGYTSRSGRWRSAFHARAAAA